MQKVIKDTVIAKIKSSDTLILPLPVLDDPDWDPLFPEPAPAASEIVVASPLNGPPPTATELDNYEFVGLWLYGFAIMLSIEPHLARKPVGFAKGMEGCFKSNEVMKTFLAAAERTILQNDVSKVDEGFYAFIAAVWYKYPPTTRTAVVNAWLVSILEPLVRAAGDAVSSNWATWYIPPKSSNLRSGSKSSTSGGSKIPRRTQDVQLLKNIRTFQEAEKRKTKAPTLATTTPAAEVQTPAPEVVEIDTIAQVLIEPEELLAQQGEPEPSVASFENMAIYSLEVHTTADESRAVQFEHDILAGQNQHELWGFPYENTTMASPATHLEQELLVDQNQQELWVYSSENINTNSPVEKSLDNVLVDESDDPRRSPNPSRRPLTQINNAPLILPSESSDFSTFAANHGATSSLVAFGSHSRASSAKSDK
ncbi:hypothetical protein C8R43DRAFT_1165624 [Mycena crocata]|nr:hypothetical protein C8R43DRAFT_1165624 [Mycena crocata]